VPSRVLLADDDGLMLEALRRLLDKEFEIVGTVQDGRELIDAAARLLPQVVVLDIGMPVLNGIEAAREIRGTLPEAKIVFLTQYSDRAYLREAFLMGASGFVIKQEAGSELKSALKEVLQKRYFISPTLLDPEIAASFDPNSNPSGLFGPRLKPRQREVLRLMAEGKTLKEIAAILGISQRTVEFYKDEVMDELGISTTSEMVRYAVEHRLIGGPPK
jgi:DNA-binding NarL/FixJ family response regulator